MSWKTLSGPLGAKMDQVDSTAVFQPGTCAKAVYDSSGSITYHGEFSYQKGVASMAAGKWVAINPDNDTLALLPDGHVGAIGVGVSALVADTYGWVQRTGKASALLAASVADNAALYTSATAGQADGTASSLSEITGARAAAATVGSSAANTDVELDYPVCNSLVGA